MTSHWMELGEETPIIRALVLARGRSGYLQQIKGDYRNEVGRDLKHGDDESLRLWLRKVENIRSEVRDGQVVYFSESPCHQHLASLIRKQKPDSRNSQSRTNTSSYNESTPSTPKSWTRSLILRRTRHDSNSTVHEQSKQPLPKQLENAPVAPKRNFPFSEDSSFEHSSKQLKDSIDSGLSCCHNNGSHFTSSFSFFIESFGQLKDNFDPCLPEFYNSILVGDNFFLNLAVMDLGYQMMKRDDILQSGFCVSGQTISEAARNISRIARNQIILLNVGSVDIAHGSELIDMICEMSNLIGTCNASGVFPILTTLPPLVNYHSGNREMVTNGFNDFIAKNPYNVPVIELHKIFLNRDGQTNLNMYQQCAKHVSGMRNPLVFWSRTSRQKVLNGLKQELGAAILKILIK